MRYATHDFVKFEIPDEWLVRSSLAGASLVDEHFAADGADAVVEIRQVRSPERNPGVPLFREERMLQVLTGIVSSQRMPPINVDQPPVGSLPYRVRDKISSVLRITCGLFF